MIKFLRFFCKIFCKPFLVSISYESGMEPIDGSLRVFINKKEMKIGKDYILDDKTIIIK